MTEAVVAIDGPGGSGKSTVAARLGERLGLAHLDTGAMYRAVALAALRAGIDPADGDGVRELARRLDLTLEGDGPGQVVMIDGVDSGAAIRGPEVTAVVSAVSAHPGVRAEMVRRQREWVQGRSGAVVEGRDIGTVVFPSARLKVFLTASVEERARRRAGQNEVGGDIEAVAADLSRRDRLDSTRQASPLAVPDGAVVIDTTGLSVEEIVEELVARW